MSHFSTVKSINIVDVTAFIKAMDELGMTKVSRGTEVRPWASQDKPIKTDVFCSADGRYGVGLVKNNRGGYDMVSDWSLTGCSLPAKVKALMPHSSQFPGEDQEVAKEGHGVARAACNEFRGLASQLTTKYTIVSKYKRLGFMANVSTDAKGNLTVKLSR